MFRNIFPPMLPVRRAHEGIGPPPRSAHADSAGGWRPLRALRNRRRGPPRSPPDESPSCYCHGQAMRKAASCSARRDSMSRIRSRRAWSSRRFRKFGKFAHLVSSASNYFRVSRVKCQRASRNRLRVSPGEARPDDNQGLEQLSARQSFFSRSRSKPFVQIHKLSYNLASNGLIPALLTLGRFLNESTRPRHSKSS